MEICPEVQSDGCEHLISFLAERGTEPFQVIYRHFVACNSPASRKRKVLDCVQTVHHVLQSAQLYLTVSTDAVWTVVLDAIHLHELTTDTSKYHAKDEAQTLEDKTTKIVREHPEGKTLRTASL